MYEYNLKLLLDYNIDSDIDWKSEEYSSILNSIIDDLKNESINDLKTKLLSDQVKPQVKSTLGGDLYDNEGDESFDLIDLYTSVGFISNNYIDGEELTIKLEKIFKNIQGTSTESGSYSVSGNWNWYGDPDIEYYEVDFTMTVWVIGISSIEIDYIEEVER